MVSSAFKNSSLIICALVFIAITINESDGAIPTVSSPPEKSCRAVINDLNRLRLRQIGVCAKKLGYKTGKEKVQKASCIFKCVMQSGGLMNQNGDVSVELFDKYIQQHFPLSLQTKAHSVFTPCLEHLTNVNLRVSGNDETCQAHAPFIKCMTTSFTQLCRKN